MAKRGKALIYYQVAPYLGLRHELQKSLRRQKLTDGQLREQEAPLPAHPAHERCSVLKQGSQA